MGYRIFAAIARSRRMVICCLRRVGLARGGPDLLAQVARYTFGPLMMHGMGILAQVSSRAVAQAAVDHASVSFHVLQWWASLMPGDGYSRAYCGLAVFVLAAHVVQLPFLLRLRAATDWPRRRRLLLALAFTEIAPLAWAVANAPAAVLAFQLDRRVNPEPVGMISALVVPLLIFLPIIVYAARNPNPRPLPWRRRIMALTFGFGPVLPGVIFGSLFGSDWIGDVAAEVGVFMCMYGVLPLTACVLLTLWPAEPGV